jgi:hypothetical protein
LNITVRGIPCQEVFKRDILFDSDMRRGEEGRGGACFWARSREIRISLRWGRAERDKWRGEKLLLAIRLDSILNTGQ